MKKTYEAPSVEKIAFMYRDQVVVASGGNNPSGSCTYHWHNDQQPGLDSGCHIDWTSAHA